MAIGVQPHPRFLKHGWTVNNLASTFQRIKQIIQDITHFICYCQNRPKVHRVQSEKQIRATMKSDRIT